jgi:hypothetical protein
MALHPGIPARMTEPVATAKIDGTGFEQLPSPINIPNQIRKSETPDFPIRRFAF